jgi:hypothetical protein
MPGLDDRQHRRPPGFNLACHPPSRVALKQPHILDDHHIVRLSNRIRKRERWP